MKNLPKTLSTPLLLGTVMLGSCAGTAGVKTLVASEERSVWEDEDIAISISPPGPEGERLAIEAVGARARGKARIHGLTVIVFDDYDQDRRPSKNETRYERNSTSEPGTSELRLGPIRMQAGWNQLTLVRVQIDEREPIELVYSADHDRSWVHPARSRGPQRP